MTERERESERQARIERVERLMIQRGDRVLSARPVNSLVSRGENNFKDKADRVNLKFNKEQLE